MIKLNKHKKVILKLLRSVKSHPHAEWIYLQVKKEIPNISMGTVYRNLTILKDEGFILKLDYSNDMSRFDGNPVKHPHIVCNSCGKVEDIALQGDSSLILNATEVSGYHVSEYRLEFYGNCGNCHQNLKI